MAAGGVIEGNVSTGAATEFCRVVYAHYLVVEARAFSALVAVLVAAGVDVGVERHGGWVLTEMIVLSCWL